jgi:hypothetical protein
VCPGHVPKVRGGARNDPGSERRCCRGRADAGAGRSRGGRHRRGPKGDRVVAGAGFEFNDGGQTYVAGSDVIADHLTDTVTISASYFTSTPVTCPGEDPNDPADDYEGSIEIGFFADAPAESFEFGDKLSSATATGSVSGDITRFDPCTGTSDVIGQDAIDVAIDLSAIGKAESSVSTDTSVDEDGNRFVFVLRSSVRSAAGSITFDGDTHQADGVIQSQWWRTPVRG